MTDAAGKDSLKNSTLDLLHSFERGKGLGILFEKQQ